MRMWLYRTLNLKGGGGLILYPKIIFFIHKWSFSIIRVYMYRRLYIYIYFILWNTVCLYGQAGLDIFPRTLDIKKLCKRHISDYTVVSWPLSCTLTWYYVYGLLHGVNELIVQHGHILLLFRFLVCFWIKPIIIVYTY